jgi:flagellar assembly protein FliH
VVDSAAVAEKHEPAPAAPPPSPHPVAVATPPPAIHAFEAAVASLRMRGEQLAEQVRTDALEIGFMVARRILEQELTVGPQPLFSLIRSAVRRLGDSRPVKIRLHPKDFARLQAMEPQERSEQLSLIHVELAADTELQPGDCIVSSDLGTVDGRLSNRLAELGRSIETLLERDAE